jgi:hypothetical protein
MLHKQSCDEHGKTHIYSLRYMLDSCTVYPHDPAKEKKIVVIFLDVCLFIAA